MTGGASTDDAGQPMADAPQPSPMPLSMAQLPSLLEEQARRFAQDSVEAWKRERARAKELEEALSTLETAYLETIRSLAFMVEAKDATTGQHLERCRVFGVALMRALGRYEEYPGAQYGFLLHDAGKIGIPERILNKPGPLTAAEWRVMRTHPVIGYQMVDKIPFLSVAAEVVRCHHEMYDGSGYPAGLKGEGIPLPARVFSVVDAFDAMTTDRPYRAAMPVAKALAELDRMAGTQFDPAVVATFLPLADRLRPE